MLEPESLNVTTLGPCAHRSPLRRSTVEGDGVGNFVPDAMRVLYEIKFIPGESDDAKILPTDRLSFERAGARERTFFDPRHTKAAIVTCGGLCPGLNNVIRSAYFELHSNYGVREVLGIRYGFQGLNPEMAVPPIELTEGFVEGIHKVGGTVLGSSRGPQSSQVLADFLVDQGIGILLCVGGDGTQRGAHQISTEIRRRKLPIAVVGIPKTIDNDIKYVWRTFGYDTALDKAKEIVHCAHNEATGVPNGIGLVKLMGREAGFIAAGATLASGQVNFTLIPEIPFALDGEQGLLTHLQQRILERHHAVIVVAEGAGQDLLDAQLDKVDASGNRVLGDIGIFLKSRINQHFSEANIKISVKYFDPSYHIRSVPANCADSLLCDRLARHAVHAAMAGKTDLLIGLWNNQYVHVPLSVATGAKKQVDLEGDLWMAVLAATGQQV